MIQSIHRQERLLSTVAEVRTILCFRVPEPALHERLPPAWRAVPYSEEAHAGANLRLPLTDQQMAFDADGKPRPTVRFVPLVVPAIRDGMDVPGPMVIAVLTAHVGEGTNDPYSNTIWTKGEVRRCSTTRADAMTSAEEAWSFEGRDGTRLSLALRYICGAPIYGRRDFRIYSGARPDFYHIYRVEHGEDIIMSKPLGIDRTQSFAFEAIASAFSIVRRQRAAYQHRRLALDAQGGLARLGRHGTTKSRGGQGKAIAEGLSAGLAPNCLCAVGPHVSSPHCRNLSGVGGRPHSSRTSRKRCS